MSKYLRINNIQLSISIFQQDFILLKPVDKATPLHLVTKAIYEAELEFADEVIGTEVEICLKLNDKYQASSLKQIEMLTIDKDSSYDTYRLPIFFGGDHDWKRIEEHSKLSRKAYLKKLVNTPLKLAMLGFLPGFLYLSNLDEQLAVPRKKTPSKRMEPGTIAIGENYVGFYSLPSPGGWNAIGRSPINILDTNQLPVVNLNIGDNFVLTEITEKTFLALLNNPLTLQEYNELL